MRFSKLYLDSITGKKAFTERALLGHHSALHHMYKLYKLQSVIQSPQDFRQIEPEI